MHNYQLTEKNLQTLFPYIKDKMVIDFVNGLDVAQRLNDHQKQISEGFISRNLHLLSGKTQIAQQNINDHLITGLQACQAYFQEIAHHQQIHAHAIIKLNNSLNQTQEAVGEIANYLADLHQEVKEINHQLTSRIDRLELSDRADKQVEHILSAWQAEKFNGLSPMGQCFLVLDTLKWGDFGLFLNQLDSVERDRQLETLKNKIINVQKSLLKRNAHEDFLKQQWLTPISIQKNNESINYALQYQGDWSWKNPRLFGMAFTATQLPLLEQNEAKEFDNLVVSMLDITRVSQRMVNNVFIVQGT